MICLKQKYNIYIYIVLSEWKWLIYLVILFGLGEYALEIYLVLECHQIMWVQCKYNIKEWSNGIGGGV